MAITRETIFSMEMLDNGHVHIKEVDRFTDSVTGSVYAGLPRRRVTNPDEDISGLPADARAALGEWWTAARRAKWEATKAANARENNQRRRLPEAASAASINRQNGDGL